MSKPISYDPEAVQRAYAKTRRDRLAGQGLCINGEDHGKATHGRKCAWCHDVHKRGIETVLAKPKFPRPSRTYRPIKLEPRTRWEVPRATA